MLNYTSQLKTMRGRIENYAIANFMQQSHKLGDVPSARDPTGLPKVGRGRKIGKMTMLLNAAYKDVDIQKF
jgi:hypothetical protein